MSLKESFDAGVGWDSASAPAKCVNKLIGEMIAVDNQPFMEVEDLGFLHLINAICPKYKVPSPNYFSDTVILQLDNHLSCNPATSGIAELLINLRQCWKNGN